MKILALITLMLTLSGCSVNTLMNRRGCSSVTASQWNNCVGGSAPEIARPHSVRLLRLSF